MEKSFLIHFINSKEPLQTVNRVQTVWLDLKIYSCQFTIAGS